MRSASPSNGSTLIVTGSLRNVAPSIVTLSLKVTAVSKVVTSAPIVSLSSPLSSRTACSRNVSSPVIALILRLPI